MLGSSDQEYDEIFQIFFSKKIQIFHALKFCKILLYYYTILYYHGWMKFNYRMNNLADDWLLMGAILIDLIIQVSERASEGARERASERVKERE